MRMKWAVAAATIGMCAVAVAPAGVAGAEETAQEVISRLQDQGYTVNIDKIGTGPIDKCVVTSVRNPQTFTQLVPLSAPGTVVTGSWSHRPSAKRCRYRSTASAERRYLLEQSSDTVMVRLTTTSTKRSRPLFPSTRISLVCSCGFRTLVTTHSESCALPMRSTRTSNPEASSWPMVTMAELDSADANPAGARIIPQAAAASAIKVNNAARIT